MENWERIFFFWSEKKDDWIRKIKPAIEEQLDREYVKHQSQLKDYSQDSITASRHLSVSDKVLQSRSKRGGSIPIRPVASIMNQPVATVNPVATPANLVVTSRPASQVITSSDPKVNNPTPSNIQKSVSDPGTRVAPMLPPKNKLNPPPARSQSSKIITKPEIPPKKIWLPPGFQPSTVSVVEVNPISEEPSLLNLVQQYLHENGFKTALAGLEKDSGKKFDTQTLRSPKQLEKIVLQLRELQYDTKDSFS